MELVRLMERVNDELERVDFRSLWPGFEQKPFALYNGTQVISDRELDDGFRKLGDFFIARPDERFAGNTATEIEGRPTAIWDIRSTPGDMDGLELTAALVHEMFHCFQQECGERRFPDELLFIDYPINEEVMGLRMLEREALLRAASGKSTSEQREQLSDFYSIRHKREHLTGCSIDYEKATESIEGTAVYAEFRTLGQLSPDKDRLRDCTDNFLALTGDNLKIRLSSYHQGLLLCLVADGLLPGWQKKFMKDRRYLSDFIREELDIREETVSTNLRNPAALREWIDGWRRERDRKFEAFGNLKGLRTMSSGFRVTGFDPMNIVKRDREVLHQNFLRIRTDEGEQLIEGPIKATIGEHLLDVRQIEWKAE